MRQSQSNIVNPKSQITMPGCGYVCPQCEGTGFTETGEPCDWCTPEVKTPDID
jgi:hypothetical protein